MKLVRIIDNVLGESLNINEALVSLIGRSVKSWCHENIRHQVKIKYISLI